MQNELFTIPKTGTKKADEVSKQMNSLKQNYSKDK